MKKPIRIAVVGLGWVGTNRHIAAIRRNPAFELAGLIDRKPGRLDPLAKRLGCPRKAVAERLSDVPWLTECDAVSIATPPDTHHRLVIEALELGLHVLTEKPFAMLPSQGREMCETARRVGRTLAVMHNFQFANSALRLMKDLEDGRLGAITRINAVQLSNPRRRLPVWYEGLPGGLFYDESPHLLYLMRRFAPGALTLRNVYAIPDPAGARTPDLLNACYQAGSVPVTLDMHFRAPVSEWHFCVEGEEGMGVVDVFRDIYLRLPNDGLHTTKTVLRTSLAATLQHWAQHFTSGVSHLTGSLDYGNNTVFARFADAIEAGGEPSGISAADALAVLEMQHALLHGAGLEV